MAMRRRPRELTFDHSEVYERVHRFYRQDLRSRSVNRDARLQRYAKYRMWTEGKDYPWPGASDIPLSDLTEKSLRMQDTLTNAVMQQSPTIQAKASTDEARDDAERKVEKLIDFQVFVEQDGEKAIGELAEAFCNDPAANIFIPWVREKRKVPHVKTLDPIPEDADPTEYFSAYLSQTYPDAVQRYGSNTGWDFDLEPDGGEPFSVKFYTLPDDRVQVIEEREVVVHDGPVFMVKDYDDVLYPVRAANLQPPSPANPHGASHVILRDFPTIDEIQRLKRTGFYDSLSDEDAEALENLRAAKDADDHERQKDNLAGKTDDEGENVPSHGRLTRLVCFDRFDIDGDGLDEDVIWWVIDELSQKVVKAAVMAEMYPLGKPMRPVVGGSFLPVGGRHDGMTYLELLEGLHDAAKVLLDQGIDAGTLANVPITLHRATGNVKPESIALEPGFSYPVADVERDLKKLDLGNPQAIGMSINLLTILEQKEDRASVVSDLQLGRVPAGKSSALRTSDNMALLAGMAEARPERILRRYFHILTDAWRLIHALNRAHLPDSKRIRIMGPHEPGKSPFVDITRADVDANFDFDFKASILNTTRAAMQQSLDEMMGLYLNPILIQLGVVTPDNLYRMLVDFGRARGQDPENKYLTPPTPGAAQPRITWEEAVLVIARGGAPVGMPAEPGGAAEHMAKLMEFANSDQVGFLDDAEIRVLAAYIAQLRQQMEAQAQQQALMAAAGQMQAQMRGEQPQGGRPNEQMPNAGGGNAMMSGGAELIDESLPTAGGGANA